MSRRKKNGAARRRRELENEVKALHRTHRKGLLKEGFTTVIDICDDAFVGLAGLHSKYKVLLLPIEPLRDGELSLRNWKTQLPTRPYSGTPSA